MNVESALETFRSTRNLRWLNVVILTTNSALKSGLRWMKNVQCAERKFNKIDTVTSSILLN